MSVSSAVINNASSAISPAASRNNFAAISHVPVSPVPMMLIKGQRLMALNIAICASAARSTVGLFRRFNKPGSERVDTSKSA